MFVKEQVKSNAMQIQIAILTNQVSDLMWPLHLEGPKEVVVEVGPKAREPCPPSLAPKAAVATVVVVVVSVAATATVLHPLPSAVNGVSARYFSIKA